MSGVGIALTAVAMAAGLLGTVVPFVPGLAVIWVAGLVYGLAAGFGTAGWVAFGLMTALLVGGTAAGLALPYSRGAAVGAPRASLVVGACAGLVGFFLVPVLGLPLGAVGGVYVAELRRLGDQQAAWRSTRAVLVGFGLGALAELAAGLAMVLSWVGWVVAG